MEKTKFRKVLRYFLIVLGIFVFIRFVCFVDDLICNNIMKVSNRVILSENWNITFNDTLYEKVNLNEFEFDTVKKGDIFILETMVPTDYEYQEACICIRNYHTTVSMYIDGELKYEYGKDRYADNKVTGSGFILVNFSDEYKGKNLRLEYTVVEDSAFSKFKEFWISEWDNSFRYILTTNRLPLLVGCFLVLLGALTTFVQIFTVAFTKKYRYVFLLSIFSVCIGIWTLCYYDIIMLFAIPLYKVSLMEYMSLFLAPIPILGYIYGQVKETNKKGLIKLYEVVFILQTILTTVAMLLHRMNLVHGVKMLKFFLVLFLFEIVVVVYVLYVRSRANKMMSKVTQVGLIIVVSCIAYELVTYILSRYNGYSFTGLKGVASVGLTIFIAMLVVELYYKVTRTMMEEQEKEILVKMAYTDELTQLYNRAYCAGYMKELYENKKSNYAIINFDLNGLKKMNDTYGHAKGDELISYAAVVLGKTFNTEGVVGRMGGDEFIVIIENDNTEYIEKLLDELDTNIKEVNKMKKDLGLSISYGYATNTEFDKTTIENVYQVADERMYAYKQKVKAHALN